MIVTTTIDLSPDIYRYFMEATKCLPDMTPEDMMSIVLMLHVINQQKHFTMSKAERATVDRLRRAGKLKDLM